jgi:hypothetical protein
VAERFFAGNDGSAAGIAVIMTTPARKTRRSFIAFSEFF